MTELRTSENQLEAKAVELIRDAIRTAESAYAELPAPFARRDAIEAETELSNFVLALVECAEALKRAHVFYQRLAEAGCIDDGEHSKEARWELQDEMGGALAKLEPL
jgi:hypothetical protein